MNDQLVQRLAGFGALASIGVIGISLMGIGGEDFSESLLLLSSLMLIGLLLHFYKVHLGRPWNRFVFGSGVAALATLSGGLLLSQVSPQPPTDALWYTAVSVTLLLGFAVWLQGVNLMGWVYGTLPRPLAALGFIAGCSWFLLLLSSVSVWQSVWPQWLLQTNILIWLGSYLTWLIWLGGELLTPPKKRQAATTS